MIGLVMAGGKGTRMGIQGEKLLLQYKKPIILHVLDALKESDCFSKIVAATSHNSPNTEKLISEQVEIIKTKGDDYVEDLIFALSKLDEPTFVVSGDLPLLDRSIVQDLVAKCQPDSFWQSFVVTKKFLDQNKLRLEFSKNIDGVQCFYTGISIVNPKKLSGQIEETCTIHDDKRIAVNLNTKQDYDLFQNS
jgi:adenosylcobinamide-phosphate guanylyltransferase